MAIDRVFVAGAGLMGHGIAQVLAALGRDVALYEPTFERAQAGRDRVAGNLERAVAKGRLGASDRDATLERLRPTDDVREASTADLVVEAIFEDVEVKRDFWSEIDRIAPRDALLASNTSSISIDGLAANVAADLRRHGGGHQGACGGPRQTRDRFGRSTRVHREPDADAVPRRGHARPRGRH